jgi:hypothetical protein
MKPETTVKKVQTAPSKAAPQKRMMMKRVEPQCPGPDPAAMLKVEIISRDAHGHGGRVRITGIVKNKGGADFTSGAGQQAIRFYEKTPGAGDTKLDEKAFQNLARNQEIRTRSIERDWTASTEFPPSYEIRIDYDPDIFADGNENNDDCNMNNNRQEREGAQISSMF